jgi:hypothetical protein
VRNVSLDSCVPHVFLLMYNLIPFDLILSILFSGQPLWSSGQSSWLQIQRSGYDRQR